MGGSQGFFCLGSAGNSEELTAPGTAPGQRLSGPGLGTVPVPRNSQIPGIYPGFGNARKVLGLDPA